MEAFRRASTSNGADRRASTSGGGSGGLTGEEATEKGSRSPYARIRTSFVAKFGNLLSSSGKDEGDGAAAEDQRKSRRKTAVKLPDIDPADLEEIRSLIKEGKESDSRRGALLGLFKMSLKETVLEAMVQEGAIEVLLTGSQEESKGSGARRAAMQAIKNLAGHAPNQLRLIQEAAAPLASIVMEEAPGSGPRQAALEALANLSANAKHRTKLAAADQLVACVMDAAKAEPQGTQGREAALVILENLSQADSTPPALSPKGAHTSIRNKVRSSDNAQEKLEEEDEEDESVDVQGLISACLDTAAKEPKGSAARLVAVRTLRNFAAGKHRAKVASTSGLYETALAAARDDGPGSETRALVFSLFSELSDDPKNRDQLMKTANLVETIIAAVRDEAPASPAKEYAMFTVANLCQEPKNRPFFMKGSGESLVSVCIRACSQELPASGGRAAALEVCAVLAMAPENQETLFKAPGLLNLAVESAYAEKSERVKKAGLDVIAALASGSDTQRAALYKMKHASDAVVKAVQDAHEANLQAAGIAALRSFCLSPDLRSNLRKATLEHVISAARSGKHDTRGRVEAICCLEEGLFDKWSDARHSFELIEVCADILKRDAPASEVKQRACSILTSACKHNLDKVVLQSGAASTLVGFVREFVEAENQAKLKKHESYSRASLRRTPVAKVQIGTPEQAATECKMALKLLGALARSGTIPEGALGACQGLLVLCKEQEEGTQDVEGTAIPKQKMDTDTINLATYVAVQAIPSSCSNSAVAKDVAQRIGKDAIPKYLSLLEGVSEKGSIEYTDVLDVLFTLSSYENCVANEFQGVVMPLVQRICEKADSGETPIIQQRLCSTLLNCLFVPTLADPLKVAEIRTTLEQVLIRIGNRGSEEHLFATAGRIAQAVTIGLKIINSQVTNPPPPGKEKRVSILCASDGLLLARKAEDIVKKIKGIHPKIEEADWFADKHTWEKIALKNRKTHLDQVVSDVKFSHAVIVCASKGAEADPVVRMMAEFVQNIGVPTIVCTGIETSNNVCWGSWLDSFKTKTSTSEASQLASWSALK